MVVVDYDDRAVIDYGCVLKIATAYHFVIFCYTFQGLNVLLLERSNVL